VYPNNVSAKHQLLLSTTLHDVTRNKKVILVSYPVHACYTPVIEITLVLDYILGQGYLTYCFMWDDHML